MDDNFEGAVELIVRNVPGDVKGQSSLSEPIIGKLAKVDGATEDCTGELKFRVFNKIRKKSKYITVTLLHNQAFKNLFYIL